ncbi:hypothetical protein C0991_008568, partial [Blastosporella zonata]
MTSEVAVYNTPELSVPSKPTHPESPLDLPEELWLLIAQHLSYKDLVKLLGLNRVFLGLAMDRRYREFRLMTSPTRFLDKIETLF